MINTSETGTILQANFIQQVVVSSTSGS